MAITLGNYHLAAALVRVDLTMHSSHPQREIERLCKIIINIEAITKIGMSGCHFIWSLFRLSTGQYFCHNFSQAQPQPQAIQSYVKILQSYVNKAVEKITVGVV